MMADVQGRRPARGVWFGVFAACTLWLFVQNVLLTLWAVSHHGAHGWAAAAAVFKAALLWISPLWVIACAALVGWAIAAYPPGGPRSRHESGEWEGRHGRAR